MSEVYEVEDHASGERLALKLLVQTGGAVPRFDREYEALTRLNHPGIVRVYHYGLYQGKPWFTMELVAGQALQSWVKSKGRPGERARTDEVIRLGFFIADALFYVHRRGLVHRDLKSTNVIVLPDGRVKLLDFGTAFVKDAIEQITREGGFVGTFSYASPEQLRGETVTGQSDLYCFGILLYRLLTGRRPFEASEPGQLAWMHLNQKPTPPSEIVEGIPPELEQLILQLMSKRAEARPEDAGDVARRLEEMAGFSMKTPGSDIAIRMDRAAGRALEMHQILAQLEKPEAGAAFVIVGGSGSGRRPVAEAVAHEIRRRRWGLLHTDFTEGEPELFGICSMMIDLVETFGEERGNEVIDKACSALIRLADSGDFQRPEARATLRRAGAGLVIRRTVSDKAPMLIVLQGLHFAGPLTLEFVAGLRRAIKKARVPVAFLVTCGPDGAEAKSSIRQRLPDAEYLQLQPLTVREVGLAVGTLLDRRAPPAEVARVLHRASGGQPFYLQEVVQHLVQSRRLHVRDDSANRLAWVDKGGAVIPLPPAARRALGLELNRMPRVNRRVLEILAVMGGEAERSELAAAIEWEEDDVQVVLEALARDGWVVPNSSGQLCMHRPLVCDLLRREFRGPRRRMVERRLASALSDSHATPEDVELLLSQSMFDEAIERGIRCAESLLDSLRPVEALAVLESVLPTVDQCAVEPARIAELFLLHANCLLMVRPVDPAMGRSLNKASELSDSPLGTALALLARARLQGALGHYPNLRKFLAEAWEHAEEAENSRVLSIIASFQCEAHLAAGEPVVANEWLEKGVEALAVGSEESKAHIAVQSASVLCARGELSEAEKTVLEARRDFERLGNSRGVWSAVREWARSLRLQGRYSEALQMLYRTLPDARRSETTRYFVRLLLETAWCEVDLARLGRAQECVDEVYATIRRGEQLQIRLEAGLLRGRILLASAQYPEALATLHETRKVARRSGLVVLAEYARALMGETMACTGKTEKAETFLNSACLGLLAAGDLGILAEACMSRGRAEAGRIPAVEIFGASRRLVENPLARVVRVEYVLADARYNLKQGDLSTARARYRKAAAVVNEIAGHLNDMDRAALRVHPWSREIRLALQRERRKAGA